MLQQGHAEIVKHASAPFVTKAFDVASPKALFMGGKVFLVGDAQVTLRPNVGLGSTHAAHDCNWLEKVVDGGITADEWEKGVVEVCGGSVEVCSCHCFVWVGDEAGAAVECVSLAAGYAGPENWCDLIKKKKMGHV